MFDSTIVQQKDLPPDLKFRQRHFKVFVLFLLMRLGGGEIESITKTQQMQTR